MSKSPISMWHCMHLISAVFGLINMLWNFLFFLLSTLPYFYLPNAIVSATAGFSHIHRCCNVSVWEFRYCKTHPELLGLEAVFAGCFFVDADAFGSFEVFEMLAVFWHFLAHFILHQLINQNYINFQIKTINSFMNNIYQINN